MKYKDPTLCCRRDVRKEWAGKSWHLEQFPRRMGLQQCSHPSLSITLQQYTHPPLHNHLFITQPLWQTGSSNEKQYHKNLSAIHNWLSFLFTNLFSPTTLLHISFYTHFLIILSRYLLSFYQRFFFFFNTWPIFLLPVNAMPDILKNLKHVH